MMKQMSRYEKQKMIDDYLKKNNPSQSVVIGFSIPEAYRYATKVGKNINELSHDELERFSTKNYKKLH